MGKPRVAFVVQRCGNTIAGGAERLCFESAQAMHGEWECELLTTCATSARTWANAFPAGATTIGGIPARRFAVDASRDESAFERASARIRNSRASHTEQEAWMRLQGPASSTLVRYLETYGQTYDRVFFFSYLYATTYFGLPAVRERAVLVPLAHDEWMLQVPLFACLFAADVQLAFVSDEERQLVESRFGSREGSALHVAVAAAPADVPAFRARYDIHEPFVLYDGRVDAAKGVDVLANAFGALRRDGRTRLRLVLAGPLTRAFPASEGVVALGRVSEAAKWAALAAAHFVVMPSEFESLSLATLEAWSMGKAVLVNGASPVLVGQCRRANGGLWYANEREFAELVESELYGATRTLGENGRRYVRERYTLERARASLRACLERRSQAASR